LRKTLKERLAKSALPTRNPYAKAVTRLRPKTIPDKRDKHAGISFIRDYRRAILDLLSTGED
jgi:hypothetical protein